MNERLKKHYLPSIIMVIAVILIFFIKKGKRDTITWITDSTGYISVAILSISLIIGALYLLIKSKSPISTYLRRDISVIGGSLAVIHSITGLFVHMRGNGWQYFLNKTEHGYSIRLDHFGVANYTGLFSALIIVLLLITSNDYSLKKLNPVRWKSIQRLSYWMIVLVFIHCYFYRIGNNNLSPFFWFYIPLIAMILTFQIIGVRINLKGMTKE
jgi:methionine sulfoxide reductase heme-binding subunit